MAARTTYTRKVSSEEAAEGYLLVLKDRSSFFPPLGEQFSLAGPEGATWACVESYACTCRGPELPHEHYFIRWPGLRRGEVVEIDRHPFQAGVYTARRRH